MFAAAFIDSAAVVPTVTYSSQPGHDHTVSCWLIMSIIALTHFLHNELKGSPVEEHADKKTDKVDDGKWTKEERGAHYTHSIYVRENATNPFSFSGVIFWSKCAWIEDPRTICEITKDKASSRICVVQEGGDLAAQTLHNLLPNRPPKTPREQLAMSCIRILKGTLELPEQRWTVCSDPRKYASTSHYLGGLRRSTR